MEESGYGVIPESPAGPEAPAPDTSAATENTAAQQPGRGPVPYDRFAEVIHERNGLRDAHAQTQARLQQLEAVFQRMQQRPEQPLTPDEQQAAAAVKRLLQRDPELQALWAMRQAAPQLLTGYQQAQALQQQYQQGYLRSGRGEIERMAGESQLPVTPEQVDYYEELVAGVIRRTPGAQARFQQGDLSVVSDAWQKVAGFLGGFRQQGAAQIAQVKQQTRNLPPAPARAGTPAGQPVQPKIDKNDPASVRSFEDRLHEGAFKRLQELAG